MGIKKITLLVLCLNILVYLFLFSEYKASYFNIDTGETVSVNKKYCFAFITFSSKSRVSQAYIQLGLSQKGDRWIQLSDVSIMGGFQHLRIATFMNMLDHCGHDEISKAELSKLRDSATEKIHPNICKWGWWYIPVMMNCSLNE